jgi:hypothetical protein
MLHAITSQPEPLYEQDMRSLLCCVKSTAAIPLHPTSYSTVSAHTKYCRLIHSSAKHYPPTNTGLVALAPQSISLPLLPTNGLSRVIREGRVRLIHLPLTAFYDWRVVLTFHGVTVALTLNVRLTENLIKGIRLLHAQETDSKDHKKGNGSHQHTQPSHGKEEEGDQEIHHVSTTKGKELNSNGRPF